MDENSDHKESTANNSTNKWIPAWFKVCVVILFILIVLKTIGLQILVEVSFDGKPFITALTDIEAYYIPLGLLLVYFVATWIWDRFFNSRDV